MAMELLIPALAVGGLGLYLSDKKNEIMNKNQCCGTQISFSE